MFGNKILIPLLLTVLLCGFASAFQVKDCASGKQVDAKLISLTIDTCPNSKVDRCDFVKGKNATMVVNFEPTTVFNQANVKIFGKLGPILVPFHWDGPQDACNNYGFNCPVKVGQKDQLSITLPVLKTYPSIKAVVRFEMNDEKKRPILCFEFPVQLTNAQS